MSDHGIACPKPGGTATSDVISIQLATDHLHCGAGPGSMRCIRVEADPEVASQVVKSAGSAKSQAATVARGDLIKLQVVWLLSGEELCLIPMHRAAYFDRSQQFRTVHIPICIYPYI